MQTLETKAHAGSSVQQAKVKVQLGVFIHNEEQRLPALLEDLARQSIPAHFEVKIHLLCNGCTDSSLEIAKAAAKPDSCFGSRHKDVFPVEFREPGKATTWNRFVHEQASVDTKWLVFVDGDIRLPHKFVIADLLDEIDQTSCDAVVSKPTATFSDTTTKLTRLAFRGGAAPHRDGAICGQLYVASRESLAGIHLPKNCLVEDGFLAACLSTERFSHPGEASRIRASKKTFHTYEAPSDLRSVYKHSIRISLGTEMNAALFTKLWEANSAELSTTLMKLFAQGECIEEALTDHERLPKNRALTFRKSCRRSLIDFRNSGPTRMLKLPLVGAKLAYTQFVNSSANRRFRQRLFRW